MPMYANGLWQCNREGVSGINPVTIGKVHLAQIFVMTILLLVPRWIHIHIRLSTFVALPFISLVNTSQVSITWVIYHWWLRECLSQENLAKNIGQYCRTWGHKEVNYGNDRINKTTRHCKHWLNVIYLERRKKAVTLGQTQKSPLASTQFVTPDGKMVVLGRAHR